MNDISFSIEAEPVPAARPRVTARGMTYYPKKHSQYAQMLKQRLLEVNPFQITGPCEVRIMFVMPRYKASDYPVHRTDVDNLSKLPLDSITKSFDEDGNPRFWSDDSLVAALLSLKRFTRDGEEPHTKVYIRPIKGSVEDYIDRIFIS